jgi:hypothetical protein
MAAGLSTIPIPNQPQAGQMRTIDPNQTSGEFGAFRLIGYGASGCGRVG